MAKAPKLRFKGFSKDWKFEALSEVVTYTPRPVPKPSGPYWRLGIRSHAKGTFHEYVENPNKVDMDTLYVVRENDLIVNITFAWEHAIAVATKLDDGKLVSHRFPTYTFNHSKAHPKFYSYYIQRPIIKYLLGNVSPGGAGRNRVLNKTEFLKIRVAVPNLDEQEKIAYFFSLLDNKIEKQLEKIEQLEKFKEGLTKKIFSKEIRFKDENGQEYPEWELKPLSELGQFRRGGTLSKSDLSENGEPCILYGELYTRYSPVIEEVYSKAQVTNNNKVYGYINDVLIPSSGETAIDISKACALMVDKVLLGGDMNVFTPKKHVSGPFLSYQINSIKRIEVAKLAQGASVIHLYSENLKNLKVWLPTYKEQLKIATVLNVLSKKVDLEKKKLDLYNDLKKSYLQQMFV